MSTLTARRPIGQFSALALRRPARYEFGAGILADETPRPAVAVFFAGRSEPAPADPDAIPAGATRIRLIGGLAEDGYRRHGSDRWINERGNVATADALNRAYVAGRVAVLQDEPAEPERPATPRRRVPTVVLTRSGSSASPWPAAASTRRPRPAGGPTSAPRSNTGRRRARSGAWPTTKQPEGVFCGL
jgi:hypothetical protein